MTTSFNFARAPLAAALFAAALSAPGPAPAGGTRIWELAGFEELDLGEPEQTSISSRGEVALGLKPRAIELDAVGLVWSAAAGAGDTVYLGTGYDGGIYRVDGDRAALIAKTGQLVVTSLVLGADGALYAAALPDAAIWRVPDPAGIRAGEPVEAERWADLPEEAKHVWALALGEGGRTLFAGTGPGGMVFAVGEDRKAQVYLDTEEEHVLSLAAAGGRRLLAGTSPGALLLEITGPGRSSALADFEGTEVKAIAVRGEEAVCAVNKFEVPPAIPSKSKNDKEAESGSSKPSAKRSRKHDLGDGALYRRRADGSVELLWERKKAHVVSLAVSESGTVFAGLGVEGKVVSVDEDRVLRTEMDLDERQVMALVAGESLELAGTGDAGGVYRIARARPAEASYLSPPLDAGAISGWGRLSWFGKGRIEARVRTGNTAAPDEAWSDWSKAIENGGEVPARNARYLQIRFSWARDREAVLRGAELAFRPLNRRAVITSVDPDSPFHDATTKKKAKSEDEKGAPQPSKRTAAADYAGENEAELDLSWKVDNPDGDELRYRLWYRAVGEDMWRPILREDDVLTKTRYEWDTTSVPEGRYEIRLVADDSLANDPDEVLSDELVSEPVLVDNHQPRIEKLAFAGGEIRGRAADGFSAISRIDFSVDAGPWLPVFPDDGVLDEATEEFSVRPPVGMEPGPHAVAVRARDRAGNLGCAEIHVDVR